MTVLPGSSGFRVERSYRRAHRMFTWRVMGGNEQGCKFGSRDVHLYLGYVEPYL